MAELRDVPATTDTPPDPAVGYARLTGLLGVAFAALLAVGLVLVHRSPSLGASDGDYTAFYGDGGRTVLVTVGLYLVPFAGIAFLWHMTTVRLLVRALTPAPSAIPYGLQIVAGGLFVGLLFAGSAAAGAVALLQDLGDGPVPGPDVGRSLTGVGYALVFHPALLLVFPGWVALTGLIVLVRTGRSGARISPRSRP